MNLLFAFKCISDQSNLTLSFLDSTMPSKKDLPKDRALQQAYESLRIYADFTYIPSDDPELRDYIENQLVSSAISYFEATLKVTRLEENVTVGPQCAGLATPQYLIDEGVAADLVILVGADYFADEFIAFAVPCGLSYVDNRPVYGALVFNLRFLLQNSTADDEANLSATLHEMTHILGFASSLYPFYINPQNKTLLKDTIKIRTVNGLATTYLDVEPLTSRLRKYFNCKTLVGAPLENEGNVGSAGAHFERRVFLNELMTASSVPDPVISEFTLALLEGSGWYQVNYNMSEPFSWGKGKGCLFLNGSCVNKDAVPNFSEFCGSLTRKGCSQTRRSQGYCGTAPGYLTIATMLPSQWNYWRNNTVVLDPFADNCPYYVSSMTTDCEIPTNKLYARFNEETYGPTSRCFTGTLNYSPQSPQNDSYCFATKCQKQKNGSFTVVITIGNSSITCRKAGPVAVKGFAGRINCPNANIFCVNSNPIYCERGCSGRGKCVKNVCQCPDGWGGVDCGIREYTDNCTRCASKPLNKACYGDLCECNPETQNCGSSALRGANLIKTGTEINKKESSVSKRQSLSSEIIHKNLKNMMDPFLSRVRGNGN